MSIRVSPTIPILRGEHRDMVEGTPLFFGSNVFLHSNGCLLLFSFYFCSFLF